MRKPFDDKDLPVLDPNTYVKETVLVLWDGLPRELLASFFFLVVSLPAIFLGLVMGYLVPGILLGVLTMGPGWMAMYGVISRTILRELNPSLLDFFIDFGHFYKRGVILGAFIAIPVVSAAWSLPLLQLNPIPTVIWVGLGADVTGLFFLTALYIYTCPQIVLYDAGIRLAMANSLILAIRYLTNTLGLIALAGLLGFLAFKVTYLLLAVLPAFWLVFVINNCRMVLRLELQKRK
jgi:uncharacterized membrane protein YesL